MIYEGNGLTNQKCITAFVAQQINVFHFFFINSGSFLPDRLIKDILGHLIEQIKTKSFWVKNKN